MSPQDQSDYNVLRVRAQALRCLREYFDRNSTIEVDTPILSPFSVTDPYMSALSVQNPGGQAQGFLQTSPEYAMKRLLCAGSSDIYQLGKVFRADENSPQHNDEFTMLEWYRVGYDEHQLMDEVYQIITLVGGEKERCDLSYRDAFKVHLGIDPFTISLTELDFFARQRLGDLPQNMLFDNYLTLLFATQIESQFESDKVTFVFDFPASQASLAQTTEREYGKVARRFEAYCGGLELANGFYELTDAKQQLERFKEDNVTRKSFGYEEVEIDFGLIQALETGLPQCSGVALGFDRLLMLKLGQKDIKQVLPMSFTKRK